MNTQALSGFHTLDAREGALFERFAKAGEASSSGDFLADVAKTGRTVELRRKTPSHDNIIDLVL